MKILVIVLVVYVGIVALFESLIGYFQPAGGSTLVITTVDQEGTARDRVLSRLDADGKLYVAVNHWPRAWYRRALENPNVQVDLGEGKAPYLAVETSGAERDRVDGEHPLGPLVRFLTGYPPRHIVRLDPVGA